MEKAILQESHENSWLKAGHNLCLQFDEGWACFTILGREHTNLKPFLLANRILTIGNLAAWNNIQTAAPVNFYLEPYNEQYLHQFFWGTSHPKARVFYQYPTREDRNSLITQERTITGDVGYIDGDISPYEGPFSPRTETWVVHDQYPAFNAYNPLSQTIFNLLLNFDVMRYTYKVIEDDKTVRALLVGEKRRHMHTIAGIDPRPAKIPDWLRKLVGSDLLKYTRKIFEKATYPRGGY